MRIAIINGPNLNKLGQREPGIYGSQSFEEFLAELRPAFPDIEITYFQSNIEGELVDAIQLAQDDADGVILNAAAYTHTSMAIGDAVRMLSIPTIEVHISNIYAREPERHKSVVSANVLGGIVGLGLHGYQLALLHLIKVLSENTRG